MNNLPGKEFFKGFLKRHPELSNRRANAIKRSRAAVSQQVMDDFFDLYAQSVHAIRPECLFNYDETNLRYRYQNNFMNFYTF